MGGAPVKDVSRAVVSAACIEHVARHFPAAAPLREEFWSDVSHPPCPCRRSFTEIRGHRPGRPLPPADLLRPLFEAGVLRWVSPSDAEAPHTCGVLFVLATGRVIINPAAFNDAPASAPPRFALPSPRFICEALSGATYLYKCDFKSYFFQIRLPEPAARAFRVWLREGGVARPAECTRVPMGWRSSTAAADCVTRYIAGVDADEEWTDPARAARGFITYIDDAITPCRVAAEGFRQRAAAAGVELKLEEEHTNGDPCRFVGLEFGPGFRVSPTLAEKLRVACDGIHDAMSDSQRRRLAGLLVAFLERCGTCLAAGWVVFDYALPQVPLRGSPREGGGLARESLQRLINDGASWRRVVAPARIVYGASDASSQGWGWVWCGSPPRWGGGRWRGDQSLHINLLEMVAVLRAIRQAPNDCELRLHVDNQVVVTWITRGTSRVRLACSLICRVEALLREKGCRLLAQYIPSGDNIADGISRGSVAPLSFSLPSWQVTYPRRVLGWCCPTGVLDTGTGTRGGPEAAWGGGETEESEEEKLMANDPHKEVSDGEEDGCGLRKGH